MERMLGTIFADLHILKVDINSVSKVLRSQRTWNKVVSFEILLTAILVAATAKHCLINREEIERLTKEVEELKKSKGE